MIPNATVSAAYVGNGVATSFAFPNYIIQAGDLTVTVAGLLQTLGVNYTVTLPATDGGNATVVFLAAPANLAAISIQQTRPFAQPSQFRNQGAFNPLAIENALDNLAMLILQLKSQVAALQVGGGGAGGNTFLSASGRKGNIYVDIALGKTLYGWAENGVWTVSDTQPA